MALKYQRILLKISGEALGGEKGMGFDEPTMDAICGGVKKAHDLGVQIGMVIGAGRFGPYVMHNKKYVSLPKGEDPMTVTLDTAIQLIQAKRLLRLPTAYL